MLAHIRREYKKLESIEREREYEAELACDEALAAERHAENEYRARAAQSLARGESEEAFEAREAAAMAAEYRVTERLNADVLALFAGCAPAQYGTETLSQFTDRRAA